MPVFPASGTDPLDEPADRYPPNFIRSIIERDVAKGKNGGNVVTRFPPEPNGFLHIGHAKAICLSFGIAAEFGGHTYLRFDDTNPEEEDVTYAEAMQEDIRWLGFDWIDLRNASDYFAQLYEFAEQMIVAGKAYVDSLTADEIRTHRGTLTTPGVNSPYRDRSPDENLRLFRGMRDGEFVDGEHVLRAKIDMTSPNMNLRDPTIYRIRHIAHHQTGDAWCIYPMYDYTHCLSDSLEGITHSLCDIGFEDHRPLYDWVLDQLAMDCHPQQIEFSRLNLQFTLMSKRKLKRVVEEGVVDGWDDPRMPTLAGLRRRGYTPASIRDFCRRIGVTKSDNHVEMALLESCIRDELDPSAPRAMAVLDPIRLIIENYPEGKVEELVAPNHPKNVDLGTRMVPFAREISIERDDFKETANRKYKRLVLGGEVRLRYGYVIRCNEVVKDEAGEITTLLCTFDEATLGTNPEDRKVRGVIHWVAEAHAVPAEIRVFEPLFTVANPDSDERDYSDLINPQSVRVHAGGRVERSLLNVGNDQRFQFERHGYYCRDSKAAASGEMVFNEIVGLRDSWAKLQDKEGTPA